MKDAIIASMIQVKINTIMLGRKGPQICNHIRNCSMITLMGSEGCSMKFTVLVVVVCNYEPGLFQPLAYETFPINSNRKPASLFRPKFFQFAGATLRH
jgi:hypothetical protein